jgi:quinolinate synthase
VNTLAEAKAEADIMCTSANAVKVCQSLNSNKVIFGPDWNLGWHVKWKTDLEIIPVPEDGYCYVHRKFNPAEFHRLREKFPNAKITVHPECNPEMQQLADHVGSTSGILKYVKETDASDYIIGTEEGLGFALRREAGDGKTFHFPRSDSICKTMKLHTLEKIRHVILNRPTEQIVQVPEPVASRAREGIERMLAVS